MKKSILDYLTHDIPLWILGLATNWLPENMLTCKLRGFLARPFFHSCGKNFQYGTRVRFIHPESLQIGKSVYIAQDGWINAKGGVTLEDAVVIGPRCGLVTTHHHRSGDAGYRHAIGAGGSAPIAIGRGTWLGMNAVVTAGCSVGKACAIAANAVVTNDIADNCLAGGVPAQIIKHFVETSPPSQQKDG